MKKTALAMMMVFGSTCTLAAVELKLGHFASDTHPCGIAALQFKANVEKRTNGEVKISLFGNNAMPGGFNMLQKQGPQFFLRNAEVAYKPSENVLLNFSFRQSPYGAYMSPYGHYSPFGMYHGDRAWNDLRP